MAIGLPLKYQVMSETGSDETVQTMLTFLPLGTVRYIDVGDNSGSQANSVSDRLAMGMPISRAGPWQDASTSRGTLLSASHSRKLRRRQSHLQLKKYAEIKKAGTKFSHRSIIFV